MSELTLYGIANCDKVRAARKWLAERGVAYRFWDLREDGLTVEMLQRWLQQTELKALINTRSTTWRQLDEAECAAVQAGDLGRLAEYPTLIRRPLLEAGAKLLVGFDAQQWTEALS